jgi:hypothetical protein
VCPLEWLVGSGLVVQLRPFDVISIAAGATSSLLALLLSDGQENRVAPYCVCCAENSKLFLDFGFDFSIALVAISYRLPSRSQDGKET